MNARTYIERANTLDARERTHAQSLAFTHSQAMARNEWIDFAVGFLRTELAHAAAFSDFALNFLVRCDHNHWG